MCVCGGGGRNTILTLVLWKKFMIRTMVSTFVYGMFLIHLRLMHGKLGLSIDAGVIRSQLFFEDHHITLVGIQHCKRTRNLGSESRIGRMRDVLR